ncbi:hypothetical protein [Acidovorax sp. BLS4]|uniref:hypothetical protein n=1 Tax=Acidovorax sp. BLS4 TaxID=3273430 RepID=UPI00294341C5|nr:hypothetical protein [Paracidovorax avenae]WOI44390.1 hypothetical protein R1Z03_17895 [Paracidovorax avenae]
MHTDVEPSRSASPSPSVLDAPAGLRSAARRPPGAQEHGSPVRSPLPQSLLGKAQASTKASAAASALPLPAVVRHTAFVQPHAGVRGESDPLQRAAGTQRSARVPRTTLGQLLAQERREEAEQARLALFNAGGALKRLKDRAARMHPSTMDQRWHAILNGKPKPMEGKRKEAFEDLIWADVVALGEAGNLENSRAIDEMINALKNGTAGPSILEQDRQMLLEVLEGWAVNCRYDELNLKITPYTRLTFTDDQVLEKPEKLGSGTFNTVFSVKLTGPDGVPIDAIFKPLRTEERGWVAMETGIPPDDPQIAMRNVATVAYVRKLGMRVVADTRVALIDTGQGRQLGMVMERARGKSAADTDPKLFRQANVCAEVTKLQLLDHLTGQGDRHAGNYFINIEPDGRAKVTGIDNDQCFGHKMTDPAGIARIRNDPSREGFHGTGLPPVVDTEMERSIGALTETDIRSMLGDKLSEAEIDAAVQRHEGVKLHIAQLRSTNRVIDPAEWGDAGVQQLLNSQNSYVGRERDHALSITTW